jgi:hypothetical protein
MGIDREEFPWHAYVLDRAIISFGTALQSDLDAAQGKTAQQIEAKRRRILAKWFPDQKSKMYADPASRSF